MIDIFFIYIFTLFDVGEGRGRSQISNKKRHFFFYNHNIKKFSEFVDTQKSKLGRIFHEL